MRTTVFAVVVVALLGVLGLTNPTTADFADVYADRLNADLATELGLEGSLANLLGGVAQQAIAAALAEQTQRSDYLVASLFTVPTAGEDLRVLGIAGQFVQLSGGG